MVPVKSVLMLGITLALQTAVASESTPCLGFPFPDDMAHDKEASNTGLHKLVGVTRLAIGENVVPSIQGAAPCCETICLDLRLVALRPSLHKKWTLRQLSEFLWLELLEMLPDSRHFLFCLSNPVPRSFICAVRCMT